MFSARRVYVYLVTLISFTAVVFAVIALLRNLLLPNFYLVDGDVALQIAILIIATPIYLGHWVWQQRKVAQDDEERGVLERRIYLYVLIGGAVAVAAANAYDLLEGTDYTWQLAVYHLLPIVLAAAVGFYHTRLLREDQREYPDTGVRGSVHRLYLYLFAAAGLIMVSMATFEILRWLLSTLGDSLFDAGTLDVNLQKEIPRLLVGLSLWLPYWLGAQRLYRAGAEQERGSVLRKFYLYAAIFVGVGGGVSTAAALLAGIFRTWLGLSPQGDIRNPVALIAIFAAIWFYHSRVLADDASMADDTVQQAEIRRIYLYLLAGVGLVALMIGLIGDISTLLYVVDERINDTYREMLAYFSAALIAGLPVWFLAWRKAQKEASRTDKVGSLARDSLARTIYLYFFLFVSIVSVLGSAVFVVYRLLDWLLFAGSLTLVDVAIPLTIAVVQLLVWFYHFATLGTDRRLSAQEEVRQLSDIRLTLVDNGDGTAANAIAGRLRKAVPGLDIQPLQVGTLPDAQAEGWQAALSQIQQAEVIVAPWSLFVPAADATAPGLAAAVAESSAQKIMLPGTEADWRWVGIESLNEEEIADETLAMLRRIVAGEEIKSRRRLGCGAIALIIIAALILLSFLPNLFSLFFYGY